ncbi:MAG: hypothetical protein O7G87_02295 [bacterium]|nr:hypothetical protein [bacterium]
MANILMIDSNPDHKRSLGGLLKYRTAHTVWMEDGCVAGARAAVGKLPDMIMINALLFIHNEYAFPRVLQQNPKTASIPFLVHSTGELGELTRKQIEASRIASVIELPISAGELDAKIQNVIANGPSRQDRTGVQPVQWERIKQKGEEQKSGNAPVRPVKWPQAGEAEDVQKVPQAHTKAKPKRDKEQGPKVFKPSRPPSAAPTQTNGTFQSLSFEQVDESKESVKGNKKKEFKPTEGWSVADSDQVKNKYRKRRE